MGQLCWIAMQYTALLTAANLLRNLRSVVAVRRIWKLKRRIIEDVRFRIVAQPCRSHRPFRSTKQSTPVCSTVKTLLSLAKFWTNATSGSGLSITNCLLEPQNQIASVRTEIVFLFKWFFWMRTKWQWTRPALDHLKNWVHFSNSGWFNYTGLASMVRRSMVRRCRKPYRRRSDVRFAKTFSA